MSACAMALGVALGCSHPMVMTTLHEITPSARHGEAIALRSMTINVSSSLMPLGFGAAGALLGASGLFWVMAAFVGAGSLSRANSIPRSSAVRSAASSTTPRSDRDARAVASHA